MTCWNVFIRLSQPTQMPFIPHIDERQNVSIVSLEDKMMLSHFHRLSLSFDMNKISSDNYCCHRSHVSACLIAMEIRRDNTFNVRWYVHHEERWNLTSFNRSLKDIFVCGSEKCLKYIGKSPKPKSSSTNHFTSSSSKLAISSHAETFVNQSFRWFNGVIKCSSSSRFVTRVHKNVWRCNIIEGVQRLFNHRVQGWRGRWRKKYASHFFAVVSCAMWKENGNYF